jgi:hypothetical protein
MLGAHAVAALESLRTEAWMPSLACPHKPRSKPYWVIGTCNSLLGTLGTMDMIRLVVWTDDVTAGAAMAHVQLLRLVTHSVQRRAARCVPTAKFSMLDRATAGNAFVGGVLQVHERCTTVMCALPCTHVGKEGGKWAKNAYSHASGRG